MTNTTTLTMAAVARPTFHMLPSRTAACPGAAYDDLDQFDDADHHQHQSQQVEERQQPRVPQQADHRQRVLRQEHERGQRQTTDAQPRAAEMAPNHGRDEAEDRETGDEDVEEGRPREEHVPVRIGRAVGSSVVLHVGHVRVVGKEWHHPERARAAPPPVSTVNP